MAPRQTADHLARYKQTKRECKDNDRDLRANNLEHRYAGILVGCGEPILEVLAFAETSHE